MSNTRQLISRSLILKKGNKIQIKKSNKGKFTEYCGGKVTSECIAKGKNSPDPKIRKRATFAANARKWKHAHGGMLLPKWAGGASAFTSITNTYNDLDTKRRQLEEQTQERLAEEARLKQEKQNAQAAGILKATTNAASKACELANDKIQKKAKAAANGLSDEQLAVYSNLQGDAKAQKAFLKENKIRSNAFTRDAIFDEIQNRSNNIVPVQKEDIPAIKHDEHTVADPQLDDMLTPPVAPKEEEGGSIHKTHGWTSILDDTGKINRRTLKLIKHVR